MKLIKNDEHGVMYVREISKLQKEMGWSYADGPEVKKETEVVAVDEEETPRLEEMTKGELELYARGFGVELDRRMTKDNMLKDFNEKSGD